ncbi:MAG: TlpA family protein disulfide reductase [Candidatus Omnitrophota bacterium]|nr:MAG: TlpA family protein disulfide reductase [Candidatus Omnitrophota bacterium]
MKKLSIILFSFCVVFIFSFKAISSAILPRQKVSDEKIFYRLDGTSLAFKELFKSSKTILFLWARSCPHCRSELRRINRKYPFDKKIQVYYINVKESKERVEREVESMRLDKRISDNILLDRTGYVLGKYRIIGVPTYLFFKDGELIQRSHFLGENLIREIFKDE